MIEAPKVSETIDPDDCRRHLQTAINRLAEIYNRIGEAPYKEIAGNQILSGMADQYQRAESFLAQLASDELPF